MNCNVFFCIYTERDRFVLRVSGSCNVSPAMILILMFVHRVS